jgi:glycosyltransferase involved in cell wall biosynthesis
LNLEKFAETLLGLADEENYERLMKELQNKRTKLITTFNSERMAKDYIELYKKLV